MNIYEAIIGGGVPNEAQTRLLAAKLRGQDDRSILAMLSGDPVLGGVGQIQSRETQAKAAGLAKTRAQIEERSSREQIAQTNLAAQAEQNRLTREQQERMHNETQARLRESTEAQRDLTKSYYDQLKDQAKTNAELRREATKATLDAAQMRVDAAAEKDRLSRERKQEEDARRLSTFMQTEGVTDLGAAISQADEVIGKYADLQTGALKKGVSDLPGMGPVANALPSAIMGDEAREVRRAMSAVRNLILQARSGAAVTDPEMRRLADELELAMGKRDGDVLSAYSALRQRFNAVKSGIMAGYMPEVVQTYQQRFDSRTMPGEMIPGDAASVPPSSAAGTGRRTSRGTSYEVVDE